MRKIYFVLFAFLFFTSILFPQGITKYYVTPNGTGDGSTWTNAGNPYTIDWSGLAEGTALGNVYVYFSGGVSSGTLTYTLTSKITVGQSGYNDNNRIIITTGAYEPNSNSNYSGTVLLKSSTTFTNIQNLIYMYYKQYITIEGIKFGDVRHNLNGSNDDPSALRCSTSNHIIINHCNFDSGESISDDTTDINDNLVNIFVDKSSYVTISNCSLRVTGKRGLQIDESENITIMNNTITTQNGDVYPNDHQLDCIQVGGLGINSTLNSNEYFRINNNIIKNSSSDTTGHDDCIQFYTRIDHPTISGQKRYQGNSNYKQIVEIYNNYIELTSNNDPKNTGIIIGGCAVDSGTQNASCLDKDENFREGRYVRWKIWGNIFRKEKGAGLININRSDPDSLYVFNNSFYTRYSDDSQNGVGGYQLIFYNYYKDASNNYRPLKNAKIVNNIFASGFSTPRNIVKFGDRQTNDEDAPFSIATSSTINYNIYYPNTESTTSDIIYAHKHTNGVCDTDNSHTLAIWKSTFNSDAKSYQINPKYSTTPPTQASHFELTGSGYYQNISFGIDTGMTLTTVWSNYNKSFDGITRGSVSMHDWDMGAYETTFGRIEYDVPPRDGVIKNNLTDLNIYPSPFNPTTTVNYTVPLDGRISLKVYDILGNEVATLVDEFKDKGKYSVVFNGENLSSGMYISVLKSNENTTIKKMILLK